MAIQKGFFCGCWVFFSLKLAVIFLYLIIQPLFPLLISFSSPFSAIFEIQKIMKRMLGPANKIPHLEDTDNSRGYNLTFSFSFISVVASSSSVYPSIFFFPKEQRTLMTQNEPTYSLPAEGSCYGLS